MRQEDKSGSFNPLQEGAEILIAVLKFIETTIGIKWLLFFLFFFQLLRYPLRLVYGDVAKVMPLCPTKFKIAFELLT